MSGTAKVASAWRSAGQGVRHAPFLHAVAILTLSVVLFTAGLVRSADGLVHTLLESLGGAVTVTVYLKDDTTAAEAEALRAQLQRTVGGTASLVTPEAALARLGRELPEMQELLGSLEDNPLPPSLELSVPEGQRHPEALRTLARALKSQPAVGDVEWGEEAVTRLSAIARALRLGALAALLVVLGVTVSVVAATLQLAIYARREEIEIQKLVGATDRFVRAPFVLEGLFQGLLGGLLAAGGLALVSHLAGAHLSGLVAFLLLDSSVPVALLTPRLALELVGGGALLGLLGSLLAVRRFLRV